MRGLKSLADLNCAVNKITSLNVSGLVNLQGINCSHNELTSLDISNLTNLKIVQSYNNHLTSINTTGSTEIFNLYCEFNELTSIDVSTLKNLDRFYCTNNKISSLDFSNNIKMRYLQCENNNLSTLELSHISILETLKCDYNLPLSTIFVKKGSVLGGAFTFSFCPNLEYICVDEEGVLRAENLVKEYGYKNCNVSSYCSFVPGGKFYTIKGNNKVNIDNTECNASNSLIPNLKYNITNGNAAWGVISDGSGNYQIPVQAGTYTITPILANPDYFTITPESIKLKFPANDDFIIQNFCVGLKNPKADLEVSIIPLGAARPGFDAKYKITYKNKGNFKQDGVVDLVFNDAILDLVESTPLVNEQTANKLSWSFTNLKPFEARDINIILNLNSPTEIPAVNNNDILIYTVNIASNQVDVTPLDNSFALRQTVVGSFDPNDKTCLEGDVIKPELIGEYVHYLIRFENTGTYPAENIVVKDLIDLSKFDISTLVPTGASHSCVTKISNGNKVEFIFEKINLPFDDAHNDGYIAFKIKTLPTLKVGDSFTNEANIYFDYNFPILTNKAISTFKTLGTQDFEFSNYFNIYPNPVKDVLNISVNNTIEIKTLNIYDILGQLIITVPNAEKTSNIDVSRLQAGNYILQVKTNKGISSSKFIKY
ncbi:T9SS type A sorting domain-containing protein [Flavobacterium panici]|uniref:T9SS type A sorting domain-containing protein n=1 Tax=Flavobacterium panici TaxID=2654843 RepID=A0A9N8J6C7_9FLAO|nr:T9SS type A sorting domain-containing protein [Flavobacterium panici]